MTTVAIIQARMGSTRLPGKVLADIEGRTMLERVVRRVRRAARVDAVVVATSTETGDDPIVAECDRLEIATFRGSETDVLDRYHQAARAVDARAVTRITADCPLIDPGLIDQVVAVFRARRPDYASNTLERTFPRGLDVEVFTIDALERAWREAKQPYERSHVTPFIHQQPGRFTLESITTRPNLGRHRWTVDTPEDLALVRALYRRLGGNDRFGWREVIELLEREPELAAANRGVRQKALEEG